jgi:hypothetical protein
VSSEKRQAITHADKRGQRIIEFLTRELGLPDGMTRLTVWIDMDDAIRVDVSFMPRMPIEGEG